MQKKSNVLRKGKPLSIKTLPLPFPSSENPPLSPEKSAPRKYERPDKGYDTWFAKLIRDRRKELKISQYEIASRLNICSVAYWRYEASQPKAIKVEFCFRLAKILELQPEKLFEAIKKDIDAIEFCY